MSASESHSWRRPAGLESARAARAQGRADSGARSPRLLEGDRGVSQSHRAHGPSREANEELPVHRLQHEKRGSVYAYTRELDAWRASRIPADAAEAPASSRRRSGWWAAGAVLLVALAVG